jgi:hypothetical protein
MTPFGTLADRSGRFLAMPSMRPASIGSVPPACEKMYLTSGQRDSVPPNNRLTIARVVSLGNSIIGEGIFGRMPSKAGAAVGWK